MYKQIKVYDLDGVLVDSSHRYRNKLDGSIDLDYWIVNRHKANIVKDKLLPMAKQYKLDCQDKECYVIICTARIRHIDDVEYIADYLGIPNQLIMRPAGNMQRDCDLKMNQLRRIFNLQQFKGLPKTLYEDNVINLDYLKSLFDTRVYIPSQQGVA